MDNILAWAGTIVSIVVAAASLIIAIRKHPFDVRKLLLDNKRLEVELADKYEEQLDKLSAGNINLRNEIQSVRERMDAISEAHAKELAEIKQRYEEEMQEIRDALVRAEDRASKFEDWAKRLVAQIESFGEVPVPFESLKRNSRPVVK